MEKKRSKAPVIIGLVLAALIIVTVVSLLTPHGEDEKRSQISRVWEGNAGVGKEGVYLMADELGETEAGTQELLVSAGEEKLQGVFRVEEAGNYYLGAGYMALAGNGQELEFQMSVDGQDLNAGENNLTLARIWSDKGEFKHTAAGDEIRPEQQEVSIWAEEPFRFGSKNRVLLKLEAGEHTVTIQGISGECLIQYLRIYREDSENYEEYRRKADESQYVEAEYFQKLEGEVPYLKSSSLLYPVYDRSSAWSLPYHSTCIRYNTVGGANWSDDGQWIEWKAEVPEDGWYQLGLRYRQNENKGQSSLRRLEIDGQVPFAEAEQMSFDYDVNWKSEFLGTEDAPYMFWLTKGEHRIRMEVVLGGLTEIVEQMQATLYDINALYREIIMITGTDPDIYRDYNLETVIPDLPEKLDGILEDLDEYVTYLEERYGKGCYSSRILKQLQLQMTSFKEKPYTIAKRLSVFKTNIEALAEWVLEFEEQSLQVDYLYLTGVGAGQPKADGNMFAKIGHEIRSFAGSFTHSYNNVSTDTGAASDVTLTVWMGKGRDQANVVQRLIDSYFTAETGVKVNISLVEGALVKATLAGQGPDVNIFTTRGEAMNLGFRGAVAPLQDAEGFDKLSEEYADSAFEPYRYEDQIFAVPETQEFYVMYIRTDIWEELGLEIPETWEDVMALLPILQANRLSIGLPYTDGYATMNNGIGTINLFPTLLAQRNIPVYDMSGEYTVTNLMKPESYEAFRQWVDFYTKYDFDLYKDEFNRFRTGEMPIVISSYALYNNLTEAAPEISGQWIMTAIPGTKSESGEVNHSTSASGTCSIVLQNCKEQDAAWEFVKWWNSAETQARYSRDIEAELSTLGRHTPANLAAFENTLWSDSEKELLLEQWKNVVEVPEIPGGYYVTRNVDNAFRQVYYDGENARDTLYYWMEAVNEELVRKQKQLAARKE